MTPEPIASQHNFIVQPPGYQRLECKDILVYIL